MNNNNNNINQNTMEKYLAALVLSQQPTMKSDSMRPHSTMKSYLENVHNIKSQLLNNLSICATSVYPRANTTNNKGMFD